MTHKAYPIQINPIKAMLRASRNGPYECILVAASQLDAARPTDDMHQWTSITSHYDAAWGRLENKHIDQNIRIILQLHPAWPVIKAIETGLKQRAQRLQETEFHNKAVQTFVNPQTDYEKNYYQNLRHMAGNIHEHIYCLDQMDIEALAPARRNLLMANRLIDELLEACHKLAEQAA